ncbi:MAG: RNA polymerase sigma-70 factor [Rhodothermales bacterium]
MTPLVPGLLLLLALSGDERLDDPELARRIRQDDREAFRRFFERYHGLLYGYLRRRNVDPDMCEDLLQNAFVTIWERRKEIDEGKSLRAYLFKIAYNRALNHFRDSMKFAGDEELASTPSTADPESGARYAMMQETLRNVVAQLPEKRRAVFELCFLEELTYREAADVLGISIKTVENQMGAALKVLRVAFREHRK